MQGCKTEDEPAQQRVRYSFGVARCAMGVKGVCMAADLFWRGHADVD